MIDKYSEARGWTKLFKLVTKDLDDENGITYRVSVPKVTRTKKILKSGKGFFQANRKASQMDIYCTPFEGRFDTYGNYAEWDKIFIAYGKIVTERTSWEPLAIDEDMAPPEVFCKELVLFRQITIEEYIAYVQEELVNDPEDYSNPEAYTREQDLGQLKPVLFLRQIQKGSHIEVKDATTEKQVSYSINKVIPAGSLPNGPQLIIFRGEEPALYVLISDVTVVGPNGPYTIDVEQYFLKDKGAECDIN